MVEITDKVKCRHCGKYISREEDLNSESGSYCRHLRETGWDDQALKEYRLTWTRPEIPVSEDGKPYIKVAALDKMLKKLGIPVIRMVKAMGGDRSLEGPRHPKFQPFYVGRARYIHPWCASPEGLDYLKGSGSKDSVEAPAGKTRKSVKAPAEVQELAEVLS
jgi:hypothetical protein